MKIYIYKIWKLRNTYLIVDILTTKLSKFFSDEHYIQIKYQLRFNRNINLNNPKGFNEKLNWLKLNYQNPLFTMMADKYWVKEYVKNIIGEEYIVPCYGIWKKVDDIDFKSLPQKSFLKSTHDSGGGVLLDKSQGVDVKELKKRFNRSTLEKKNWYWHLREWPYKNISPRILAEQYLDEGTGHEIHDFKFYCFNGVPHYMYITNKGTKIYENFYDMDFNPVNISHGFERYKPEFIKPHNWDKMKELASILSKGLPFVRVDFFNIGEKLYFGEFTFYDWGGMKPLTDEWEYKLGELIKLPK